MLFVDFIIGRIYGPICVTIVAVESSQSGNYELTIGITCNVQSVRRY